jgi:hypothetical protein
MKLYQAWYKGRKYGRLCTPVQKSVIDRCFANLAWEEVQ